mmetsp:Transcript_86418/g.129581  ORF Transcript_86418/g.129581 Transcript_86418/m.129581 type:complete len:278 (-) Transcript_86418:337-1170(-)
MRRDSCRLCKHLAWEANAQVRCNPPDCREHADATVLELCLAAEVHGKRLSDPQRVEAFLATNKTVKLRGVHQVRYRRRPPIRVPQQRDSLDLRSTSRDAAGRCCRLQRAGCTAHAHRDVLDEEVHGRAPEAVCFQHLDRVLAEHAVLDHQAHNANHGQPPVVAFNRLASFKLLRRQALQELRAQAQIPRAHATRAWLDEHFMRTNEGNKLHPTLDRNRRQCAQTVFEALTSWEAENLRNDVAKAGNHGNTAVLDFHSRIAVHLCISAAQVCGIPLLV